MFRFAVVSDSHIRFPDDGTVEYPSNTLTADRNRFVVDLCNRLRPEFVIHLGDIVHPLPTDGLDEFRRKTVRWPTRWPLRYRRRRGRESGPWSTCNSPETARPSASKTTASWPPGGGGAEGCPGVSRCGHLPGYVHGSRSRLLPAPRPDRPQVRSAARSVCADPRGCRRVVPRHTQGDQPDPSRPYASYSEPMGLKTYRPMQASTTPAPHRSARASRNGSSPYPNAVDVSGS